MLMHQSRSAPVTRNRTGACHRCGFADRGHCVREGTTGRSAQWSITAISISRNRRTRTRLYARLEVRVDSKVCYSLRHARACSMQRLQDVVLRRRAVVGQWRE